MEIMLISFLQNSTEFIVIVSDETSGQYIPQSDLINWNFPSARTT